VLSNDSHYKIHGLDTVFTDSYHGPELKKNIKVEKIPPRESERERESTYLRQFTTADHSPPMQQGVRSTNQSQAWLLFRCCGYLN